ncbi:hypothetical protein BKA93DRAFT_623356 [Sparassis latifolia]|uniref:Concanavalin A-like lectin/glucanase n=1 Tax=Sparassis crispa TaxID=139825 RepID=A0A401GW55_9APHY|nr:hypothetical protein SCP_0903350 [Sparassis crispa]GBE86456.1 hypothetical protein SCP_0903350 [Sparassis crispa]
MFFFLYVLTFLSALAATSAIPRAAGLEAVDWATNAQRLAAGLPLLPPKFKRAFPGQNQARDDPTPAFGAKRSVASSTPVAYSGHIEIKNITGSSFGFLAQNQTGINGVSSNETEYIAVSFTTTTPAAEPFNILISNPAFPSPFYLGGNGTNLLASDSASIVTLGDVVQTAPSAPPSSNTNEESAIWSINSRTQELTVQWINSDSSKVKTYIAYDEADNILFFAGNISVYNAQSSKSAVQVKFYLSG